MEIKYKKRYPISAISLKIVRIVEERGLGELLRRSLIGIDDTTGQWLTMASTEELVERHP
jgi:hypothetical protein